MAEPPSSDQRTQSPQSVLRIIRILEALCSSPRPLSLAELSRGIGTPKSSLAALLRGLENEHFVAAADGVWRLGPGAFGLGSALVEARRRFPAAEFIRAGMRRLADRTGETVLFGVRDGELDSLTYVDVIESRSSVRFAVSIGDRRPLYPTAGGRALLAAAPAAEVRAYLDRIEPAQLTGTTQTDRAQLAQTIATARAQGFAQTVEQAAAGVIGTAAGIRDAGGTVLGALIVAAPSLRMQDRLDELARLVCDEATHISRSLGFRPPFDG